jgi:hypothetical protein
VSTILNAARALVVAVAVLVLVSLDLSSTAALTGDIGIHDPSVLQVGNCAYAFGTGDPNVQHGTIRMLESCGGLGAVGLLEDGVRGDSGLDSWRHQQHAGQSVGAGYQLREGELAFGSFWDGIKMIDIDPGTGKRQGSNIDNLASRGGGAIEAASISHVGGRYYLYVSFDRCCAGARSTYRIMVGRALTITGPYVDQNGGPLIAGGGSQLLASNGVEVGPGGEDVLGAGILAYHFYDGNANGSPKLAIRSVSYANGWPRLGSIR